LQFWLLQQKVFLGGDLFFAFWAGFFSRFGVFLFHFLQKILENPDFPTPSPGILPGGGSAK
jgi:hypothetical protein